MMLQVMRLNVGKIFKHRCPLGSSVLPKNQKFCRRILKLADWKCNRRKVGTEEIFVTLLRSKKAIVTKEPKKFPLQLNILMKPAGKSGKSWQHDSGIVAS
jgi:hypothetical protein